MENNLKKMHDYFTKMISKQYANDRVHYYLTHEVITGNLDYDYANEVYHRICK